MSADSFEEETKYAEIYMEFSDLIGESNMRKVYNRYRGLKVDFPKRIYSKEYVVQMLRKFEGKKTVSELAKEYDYSERYIRKLIAQVRDECHASNYCSHLRQLYRRLNSAFPIYCLS